jgi:hypothetical protein
MKKTLSFTVANTKPRNVVAQAMFDRSGPYKSKAVKVETTYKRQPKHRNRLNQDI